MSALEVVDGVMDKMANAIPSVLNKVISAADKNLHADVSDFLKMIMLGYANKNNIETQLNHIKDKWGNIDLGDIKNFDDLEDLLRSGAIDLDAICKLIPNVEKEGVEIVVKATPTSIPDIDPASILKGGKLPDLPEPNIVIGVSTKVKEQADEFLNLELPDFDW